MNSDITIYDIAQFEHDFELFVDMYEAKMKLSEKHRVVDLARQYLAKHKGE